MTVGELTERLLGVYPLGLQESYDNSGLQVGRKDREVKGVLVSVDATEAVIEEAEREGCNYVLTHHPIIFRGVKRLTGEDYVQRTVEMAIEKGIAICSLHTNADNHLYGVSRRMAEKMGLRGIEPLEKKREKVMKVVTYVPKGYVESVCEAGYAAGGGTIGSYDKCSYRSEGVGTFRAGEGCEPFCGEIGKMHAEAETRVEMVARRGVARRVAEAIRSAHPYEEAAIDIIEMENEMVVGGCGAVGELEAAMEGMDFLRMVKERFGAGCVRHTSAEIGRRVKRVALCGGSGAEFVGLAIAAGADAYITADVKYHQFFDADGRIIIADIGHFESEECTKEMFLDVVSEILPTFAIKSNIVNTNPVKYL